MEVYYKDLLLSSFQAGVKACLPKNSLPSYLKCLSPKGRVCVLGAGKAAAQMAAVVYTTYPDQCYGTVVTRYGHGAGVNVGPIDVLEAAHPVPDQNSLIAAKTVLAKAASMNPTDLAVVLLSGGGSAVMCAPVEGVSFEDKMKATRFLLNSGASINEINCVRKHLSAIKGGGLAHALSGKTFVTYAISDVVGDDVNVIASGPTARNDTRPQDALNVLETYGWQSIYSIEKALNCQALRAYNDEIHNMGIHVVASSGRMLEGSTKALRDSGWAVEVLGTGVTGDAATIARQHAELVFAAKGAGKRTVLLSGGELTVAHDGAGKGGPNQEYLLALAEALGGEHGVYAVACDTDGIDGVGDAAGAFIAPDTLTRAQHIGLSARDYLERHDSYSYFAALDDLIVTGPTGTNVNDFRAILVDP
ncbi:MAG: glycerate kinase [Kordiimonas sp.]